MKGLTAVRLNEIVKEKKRVDHGRVRLQKRDYEIFKFLLDMKFSDIEGLHEKFFKDQSMSSPHLGGARTRVLSLYKAGYLNHRFAPNGTSRKYYMATLKAYRALVGHVDGEIVSKPHLVSDATFSHDELVLKSRLVLEGAGRASNWRSEKLLKAEMADRSIVIEREFMPDGVFTSKHGYPCAFELELSPKTKKRYRRKILRFIDVMEDPQGLFDYCLFVVKTPFTYNTLKELTTPYGNRFQVEWVHKLLPIRGDS